MWVFQGQIKAVSDSTAAVAKLVVRAHEIRLIVVPRAVDAAGADAPDEGGPWLL